MDDETVLLSFVLPDSFSPEVGHGRRKQEVEGRQEDKEPDRLIIVGRNCLILLVPQSAAAAQRVLFVLFCFCFGLPVLSLAVRLFLTPFMCQHVSFIWLFLTPFICHYI